MSAALQDRWYQRFFCNAHWNTIAGRTVLSVTPNYLPQDHTSPKISNARAVEQSSTLSSPWPFPELFWRLITPWGEAPRQPWAQNRSSIRAHLGPGQQTALGIRIANGTRGCSCPVRASFHLWGKQQQHCFCPRVQALWRPQSGGHASVCIPTLNPTPNSVSAVLVPAITGLQWN